MPRNATSAELESYFRDVRRYSPLGREKECELARCYRAGDIAAGHKLIAANLRFVVKVAGEYRSSGLPIADLVQEGNLGLMRAVSKFDPDRGLRLISYAVWWIRAFIQAYVLRSWSLVRIGTTQAQRRLFFTLGKEYRYFRERGERREDGEGPDAELLARRLRVAPGEVIEMHRRISGRDTSLDAPMFDGSDLSLMDRLECDGDAADEALATSQEARLRTRHVRIALSRLTDRERLIVERRDLSDDPVSLQTLATELHVSGERVRQLEIRARAKIHATLDSFAPAMAA